METLLMDRPVAAVGRTVTVGPADSGRMLSLRVGDRLAFAAPTAPGLGWRLRGGAPLLEPTTPQASEPAFVLRAARAGRVGVDLVAAGAGEPLPRPIRLIVTVA